MNSSDPAMLLSTYSFPNTSRRIEPQRAETRDHAGNEDDERERDAAYQTHHRRPHPAVSTGQTNQAPFW